MANNLNSKKRSRTKYCSILLADIILSPEKAITKHADGEHGFKRPTDIVELFKKHRMISDAYPNFFNIGFISQAFVDIKICRDADLEKIKRELHDVYGVIMIYTVFGNVDFKCKIVGESLRSIELISLKIRKIEGISDVITSIVIDNSDPQLMRKNWSEMIRSKKEEVDSLIRKTFTYSDDCVDDGSDDGG